MDSSGFFQLYLISVKTINTRNNLIEENKNKCDHFNKNRTHEINHKIVFFENSAK